MSFRAICWTSKQRLFNKKGSCTGHWRRSSERRYRLSYRRAMCSHPTDTHSAEEEGFRVKTEKIAYKRYLTILDRHVQHPASEHSHTVASTPAVHSYDVVSSRHPHFCVVFPFHPNKNAIGGEVTLLREYAQGLHSMVYCLPSGGYDPTKHTSKLHCAQQELSEEAHLRGGQYHCLIPDHHPGIPEVKWCANRFTPFLVISPESDASPSVRDQEEYIQIKRMTMEALKVTLLQEEVLPPTTVTCHLAFEKLRSLGYL